MPLFIRLKWSEVFAGVIAILIIGGATGALVWSRANASEGTLGWLSRIAGTHTELYASTDAFGRVTVTDTPSDDAYAFRGREVAIQDKPIELQIFDFTKSNTDAYPLVTKNLREKCTAGTCTDGEKKGLAYIESLEGNYVAATTLTQGNQPVELTIRGTTYKQDGAPLPGATITVISDPSSTPVTTADDGTYSLILQTTDLARVRLQATKAGYSDATIPFDTLGLPASYTLEEIDFKLAAPARSVVLDTSKKTVVGEGASVTDVGFVVTTDRSTYTIPFGALVHRDGRPFTGTVEAFLFEFDKSSEEFLHNLLKNDVFDDVAGYAGDIMKTFGMPYIKFITTDGETIHVLASQPMTLRYRLPEMEALRTNQDQIYVPLTEADMELLVSETERLGGYPIDRQFLISHELVRFPAFWVFDQVSGIWENIGVKVLSKAGDLETSFYTLNDR